MRDRPVRIEKIAVLRAMRPGFAVLGRVSAAIGALLYAGRGFSSAALSRYGQHSLTEEADPALRARAPREPPLHLRDPDVLPAPRGCRHREGRHAVGR